MLRKHILKINRTHFQIFNDSAGENLKEYLEINRTHYPSPSIIQGYPSIKLDVINHSHQKNKILLH